MTSSSILTPVILSPAEGSSLRGTPLPYTISGTGTPGTHVYVTVLCTLPAPACTMPEQLGQAGQDPIVVGADGRWSVVDRTSPDKVVGEKINASAARIDASGSTVEDASGTLVQTPQSATRTITVGPAS